MSLMNLYRLGSFLYPGIRHGATRGHPNEFRAAETSLQQITAEDLAVGMLASVNVLNATDLSDDENFQRLALLSITGPHSWMIFEVFDLYDVINTVAVTLDDYFTN